MTSRPFTHDPSNTAAFTAVSAMPNLAAAAGTAAGAPLRACVIGGGTGAPVSIRTLLSMGFETSAVVAMADDGGSTGILRAKANVTPPGDVRKCLAAFAANANDPLTRAFKCRFDFAQNHTLGNLMLSALEEETGSFVEAVRICEDLLGARGHVHPSTLNRVTLVAEATDGTRITGQVNAGKSACALKRVQLRSAEPLQAFEGAVAAIREADLIVLGPGSLFTSIIPNLLVPGIVEAIRASKGCTVFVCSLADAEGETAGMSVRDHVDALRAHGLDGLIDFTVVHAPHLLGVRREAVASAGVPTSASGVPTSAAVAPIASPTSAASVPTSAAVAPIATPNSVSGAPIASPSSTYSTTSAPRPVAVTAQDIANLEALGIRLIVRDLVDSNRPTWHDPRALRAAFAGVMRQCHSRQM